MRFDTNRAQMESFDNDPAKEIHVLSVAITDFLSRKKYFAYLQTLLTVINLYFQHLQLKGVS